MVFPVFVQPEPRSPDSSRSIPTGRTASLLFSSMPQTSGHLMSRSSCCLSLPLLLVLAEITAGVRRYCEDGVLQYVHASLFVQAAWVVSWPVARLPSTQSIQHRHHSQRPGRFLRMSCALSWNSTIVQKTQKRLSESYFDPFNGWFSSPVFAWGAAMELPAVLSG